MYAMQQSWDIHNSCKYVWLHWYGDLGPYVESINELIIENLCVWTPKIISINLQVSFKIYFNIICPSMPKRSKNLFPADVPDFTQWLY